MSRSFVAYTCCTYVLRRSFVLKAICCVTLQLYSVQFLLDATASPYDFHICASVCTYLFRRSYQSGNDCIDCVYCWHCYTCTCTCICNLLIIRYSRGTRQALANDKIITRSRIYICELRASGARVASESCNASVNLWVSGTVHLHVHVHVYFNLLLVRIGQ